MNDFEYLRPTSLSEAVRALRDAGDEGKLLAGGQSLIPIMKLGLAAPEQVVSLAGVAELSGISHEGETVVIGATARHIEVARSSVVLSAIPALAHLAGNIGDAQVRNRGTLGGSLAHDDPAADYPAAVLGLGATIHTDRRKIDADDFFVGMFETALEPDEIITKVTFPIPRRAAYAKFPNPASGYALAGVFVSQGPKGVRVAVTGAGQSVFRVSAMEQALANRFAADALDTVAVSASGLASDLQASAEYRAHLVTVMAKRAVAAAGGS